MWLCVVFLVFVSLDNVVVLGGLVEKLFFGGLKILKMELDFLGRGV